MGGVDRIAEQRAFSQTVQDIFIAEAKGLPMRRVGGTLAVVGEGLAGDRYPREGSWVKNPEKRDVTLISTQGIDLGNAAIAQVGVGEFPPEQTRRNVVIDMKLEDLNSLVGRRFRIGDAEFEGLELCEPCRTPAARAGRPSADGKAFEDMWPGKAGIRAKVVRSGEIHVGDMLTVPFRSQTFDESSWPTRVAGSNRRVV